MGKPTFGQAVLALAPLTTPICALCGGILGALSGGSIATLADPALIAFTTATAFVGGVPTGLLFWAMKDTPKSIRTIFVLISLLVCCLAFIALFVPLHAIANH